MSDIGNKEILAKNLRYYFEHYDKRQIEVCEDLGLKVSTLSDWLKAKKYPRIDKIELLANYFGISKSDLIENRDIESTSNAVRINVYGTVPAGVPIEAVEDIVDWEELPREMTAGGKEYFGLRVKGDSMFPRYLDGDTIIVLIQPDCESGEDAVVYVNGYDATLKKVIKKETGVLLQPLNHNYEPVLYSYVDLDHPVTILGVVDEIRRKVR